MCNERKGTKTQEGEGEMKPIYIEVLPQKEDDVSEMILQISKFIRGSRQAVSLMEQYKYERDYLRKENITLKKENDRLMLENGVEE